MEKELRNKFKYQIYNKSDKIILPYYEEPYKYKQKLIDAIKHDLGGNPNLVVVISKDSMDIWEKEHSEKAKEEARKEAIHWLSIPDGYYSDIKTLYSGQRKAAYALKEAYSNIPDNVLYKVDGFSVVYDRIYKEQ